MGAVLARVREHRVALKLDQSVSEVWFWGDVDFPAEGHGTIATAARTWAAAALNVPITRSILPLFFLLQLQEAALAVATHRRVLFSPQKCRTCSTRLYHSPLKSHGRSTADVPDCIVAA